jgi:hypothetical protein
MKKKRQPPSRVKYDKSHPVVSIRVSREMYEEIKSLQDIGGKSLGDILREALDKQEVITDTAYKNGFNIAKFLFGITFKCNICKQSIMVQDKNLKDSIVDFLESNGCGHSSCHERS